MLFPMAVSWRNSWSRCSLQRWWSASGATWSSNALASVALLTDCPGGVSMVLRRSKASKILSRAIFRAACLADGRGPWHLRRVGRGSSRRYAVVSGHLQLMLEITERALAVRPAHLLATVQRLRAAGWRIALDDVGADDLSLAFMPLLQPDVIKLDMALVQRRPGRKVAEIMNAVNSYAERTGSVILAEGIEDADHLVKARALGATLGQGWWFGRPAEGPVSGRPSSALRLPPRQPVPVQVSPFQFLPESVTLRHTTKALLIEVSKHLEREARRLGGTCLVVSTFQHATNFTPSTARRYQDLAANIGFVAAIGAGLNVEPVPGVRGADLEPGDPVRMEWDIAVLAPHFAAVLIARDLAPAGDDGGDEDQDRFFEFALTYDRNVVEAAARTLMSRVLPNPVDGSNSPSGTVDTGELGGAADDGPRSTDNPADQSDAADRDPVADLLDRQRLVALAEAPLLDARMNNTGAAILHLHLDNLRVADARLSEAVLKAAADRLQRRIRRRDLMGRHHDNIIIVLPASTRETHCAKQSRSPLHWPPSTPS